MTKLSLTAGVYVQQHRNESLTVLFLQQIPNFNFQLNHIWFHRSIIRERESCSFFFSWYTFYVWGKCSGTQLCPYSRGDLWEVLRMSPSLLLEFSPPVSDDSRSKFRWRWLFYRNNDWMISITVHLHQCFLHMCCTYLLFFITAERQSSILPHAYNTGIMHPNIASGKGRTAFTL